MLRFYKSAAAILLAVAILEGFLIFRLSLGKQPPESRQLATRSVEPASDKTSAAASNAPLPSRSEEQQQEGETPVSVSERLKAGRHGRPMIDRRTGSFHEDLLKELGCSNSEREVLDSLLASTHRNIDALLRAHATVTEAANGRIDIAVAPFVEDGTRIYDDLARSLEKVLGQERSGALMGVYGQQVEQLFGHFGAAERSISITQMPQSDGSTRILLQDTRNFGAGMGQGTSSFRDFEDFERRSSGVVSCLPEETRKRLANKQSQPQTK